MVTLNVLTESANGYLYVYYEYVTVANTLSFGESGSIEVIAGQAIGDLPAVPAKDGYEGFWTLDGQQITAETVWSYTVNKTAEAVYYEVVNSIGADVWTDDYRRYPEKDTLGTYYIGGRKFYGVRAGSTPPAWITTSFAWNEAAVAYLISNAPAGTNAIKVNVYYTGSEWDPNAFTHLGYQSGQTVNPQTWGTRTVAFSVAEEDWSAFMTAINTVTESANGYVYLYYEYVTI